MKLFGTDGIRGSVGGEKINSDVATRLGKALIAFCRARNLPEEVIIARDTRESGSALEDSVVEGIIDMGGKAILAGVLPTPGLAYLARTESVGMGLVISASHNPFGDNGFKPFTNEGIKLTEAEEEEMERYILGNETVQADTGRLREGEKVAMQDAKEKYVKMILEKAPPESANADLKLAIDCANGATHEVAALIFGQVVREHSLISADPDGKNINDNCGSQHPDNLKKEVFAKKADLGLAFDGDGDRVIAVDEKGQALTGDQIIYIIAKMLKEKDQLKSDLVITTVMSNIGFVGDLKKMGIGHFATAVGDQPVFRKMKETGAVLGGEESGHVILSDYHPAGDGIVGGIMIIAAMNYFSKPLSELAAEVALFPKLLLNVPVASKPELATIPEITAAIRQVEKKLGEEGRVLVRYSGTENLCRVMIEGKNEKEVREYAEKIARVVEDKLA